MVKVKKVDGKLEVSSPFNSKFIALIKEQGGKWDARKKVWTVDEGRYQQLNDILKQVYDYDMEGVERVNVEIDLDEYMIKDGNGRFTEDVVMLGDIVIVRRPSRDAAVVFSDIFSVFLNSGRFTDRGGSVKYPKVDWETGTKIEVHGVSKTLFESIQKDRGGITVIGSVSLQNDKVLEEQIAEINRQISELENKKQELIKMLNGGKQ